MTPCDIPIFLDLYGISINKSYVCYSMMHSAYLYPLVLSSIAQYYKQLRPPPQSSPFKTALHHQLFLNPHDVTMNLHITHCPAVLTVSKA